MKSKIIISAVFFLMMSQHAYSQWVDNGISTYTYDKIGIGTNSPISTFSVVGTARFDLGNDARFKIVDWNLAGSNNACLTAGNYAETAHVPLAFAASLFYFHSGNVGIGTSDTKGYKLAVAGNMVAEEITVKLQNNWPDYVFESGYTLMPLCELERFIEQNNHLPNIPSDSEVKKNGINLSEMNAKLLQKVEELTLYVIEQQKQISDLNQKVESIFKK